MARIRNLFAPEWMETRLSPSTFIGFAQPMAEVSDRTDGTDGTDTGPSVDMTTSDDGTGSSGSQEPLPRDEDGDPIPRPARRIGPGVIVTE